MKSVLACLAIALVSVEPVCAAPASIPAPSSAQPTYKLGVADKVRVTVFSEPTLSGEFLVNADGSLALPLIGNVRAAGLSAPEIQTALEAKYADGLLNTPRVASRS